eukprot:6761823-Pyramimonas_sp.AAC.1
MSPPLRRHANTSQASRPGCNMARGVGEGGRTFLTATTRSSMRPFALTTTPKEPCPRIRCSSYCAWKGESVLRASEPSRCAVWSDWKALSLVARRDVWKGETLRRDLQNELGGWPMACDRI